MAGKILTTFALLAVSGSISFAVSPDSAKASGNVSAAQIVDRNIAARGGLQAWRAINTLSMTGKMEAGGNNRPTLPIPGRKTGRQMPPPRPAEQYQLPFVMELQRPRKIRVELQFNGQSAVQVFDGNNGWKVRPFLNRREVEPYTPEEMKATSTQAELDGYLVDYVAKGTKVELTGMEKVDNRDNYKLQLTLKSGETLHLWIDARTFLESKIEGTPRRLDGKYHPVEIYLRDFRSVNGLMFPFLFETRVADGAKVPGLKDAQPITEAILVDKVVVNPRFDVALFSKPQIASAANTKPAPAKGGSLR
jgi:hypothetical protein